MNQQNSQFLGDLEDTTMVELLPPLGVSPGATPLEVTPLGGTLSYLELSTLE